MPKSSISVMDATVERFNRCKSMYEVTNGVTNADFFLNQLLEQFEIAADLVKKATGGVK